MSRVGLYTKNWRLLFGLSVFFVCNPVLFTQEAIKTINAQAAAVALERASYMLTVSEWDQALFEAKLGSAYDPLLADFSYIEALVYIATEKPRYQSIERLEYALSKGLQWRFYNKSEATLLCSRLYAETNRYTEALSLLDKLKPYSFADADFVKILCLLALGQNDKAIDSIDSALDTWPFDVRFPRLFLERFSSIRPSQKSVSLSTKILSRLYVWENEDRELLLLAVPFIRDAITKEKNILTYRSMGKNDSTSKNPRINALSAVFALELGLISENTAVQEIIDCAQSGIELDLVQKILDLLITKEARNLLLGFLSHFSGLVINDANNDGIIDSYIQYEAGRPSFAFFDPNQDGLKTISVYSDFGSPLRILMGHPKKEIFYDTYPYIKSVKEENREYSLRPRSLSWAPIEWVKEFTAISELSFYSFFLTNKQEILSEKSLLSYAAFYTEPDLLDGGFATTHLDNGSIISSESKENGVLYKLTKYVKGIPSVSQVDRDRDGVFETLIYYSNTGKIKNILVDLNNNKIAEYKETWISDSLKTIEWDSDENGIWDISWQERSGSIVSITWLHPQTKLPVLIEIVQEKPRSVSYNNKTSPVIKDIQENVWWVGRVPSSASASAKKINDFFNQSEVSVVSTVINSEKHSIFAVRTGGYIFAELLND